jgi:tryptophan synthase beta chain
MVKISYQQKPHWRNLINRRDSAASPTNLTDAGRSILALDSENMGSLGIAISRRWCCWEEWRYVKFLLKRA